MKVFIRKSTVGACMLLFLFMACKNAPEMQTISLPRSVPEQEGVSSAGILNFLDAADTGRSEFHSFVFLRHGKVIAEGWWNPYDSGLRHTLYSTSKSFTSTAIGFAVSEKLLTVNDKVISFFPDDLPDTVSPDLEKMTVRDLLSMATGQDPEPTSEIVQHDSNWVKAFLSVPVVHEPGTKFSYNSMATYMLSAIVQKVTGEKVIDYLRPRLFDPLQISGMDWETDPAGINTGGWGLRLKTEDMAKFGQFYLQKGKWNGIQLLPESWITEATTFKIDQAPDAPQSGKDSSDWMQGYCYQFWRCRNNAFRGDGAFGQFIIVMPEKDAVVAITAETPDMQDEINLVWKYLLPAISSAKLPEDTTAVILLRKKLDALALPLPATGTEKPDILKIAGKTFLFPANDRNMKSIRFAFSGDTCMMNLAFDTMACDITFGEGKWIRGVTTMKGPNLLFTAKNHFAGLPPAKIAGSYGWKDKNTLVMVLRYIESPHTETITCHFEGNKVNVDIQYTSVPYFNPPVMTAVMKKE
jgi:CubicO group peptidase (beta-lactamase class C family)